MSSGANSDWQQQPKAGRKCADRPQEYPMPICRFLSLTGLLIFTSLASHLAWALEPIGIALEGYPYPYDVQQHEIAYNGESLYMAYMDVQPERANGDTVVLLHGKNFGGAYWGQTARDLAAEGYRVVIPDQIGFGKSSKPVDYVYSFHALASNTQALLAALNIDRATILGHSMGGMVAARFALMFPESTKKLVLVNPIGLEDWKAKGVPYRSVDDWYSRELNKSYDGIKAYQLSSYYDGQWKAEYDPWVELLARMTLSPEYPRMARVQALTYDMIYTQPVVHEFPLIQVPTHLIIGGRDRTALGKDQVDEATRATLGQYESLGKEAAAAIPNASLTLLDGIGHLPHIEAYDRFLLPLLEFLGN